MIRFQVLCVIDPKIYKSGGGRPSATFPTIQCHLSASNNLSKWFIKHFIEQFILNNSSVTGNQIIPISRQTDKLINELFDLPFH